MGFSGIKDFLDKNSDNKSLNFIRQNLRYFVAGALFVALVLVVAYFTNPKPKTEESGGTEEVTETLEQESVEEFQVDAYADVNNLITQYYTAYVAGDMATLTRLAIPVSENEQAYIALFGQYVEAYQDIKRYTKRGLDDKSYLVYVSLNVKFNGVDTVAPGLDFFYVRTNDDGTLYIDNLYSQYNLAKKENALDTSIQSLILEFINEEDALALHQETQEKYDAAVASDEALATMVGTSIPTAIEEWVAALAQQVPEDTESTEDITEPTEDTIEQMDDPINETQQTKETVYAIDTVNIRLAADTASEKLGSLEKGDSIERTGTEGDWSIVDYNGTSGYIKTEYLTTDASTITNDGAIDHESGIAAGTVVTLNSAVNIRSGMSATTDKIGTAYAGEKVKVVMSYAEGWTKVTWNDKTGYIKTSLLQ